MSALTDIVCAELPGIPPKRYFTISEVAELCDIKPHVLRYWEQEFPQLKPMKRRGNRRYYQQHDVELVRQIRGLLYEQGYTIAGARQRLRDLAKGLITDLALADKPSPQRERKQEITDLRDELESLLRLFPQ